jgi:hypothetical protein
MEVTVVGDTAYTTDSIVNQIVSMNVDDALRGICNITSIKLPVNSFLSDEDGPIDFAKGMLPFVLSDNISFRFTCL